MKVLYCYFDLLSSVYGHDGMQMYCTVCATGMYDKESNPECIKNNENLQMPGGGQTPMCKESATGGVIPGKHTYLLILCKINNFTPEISNKVTSYNQSFSLPELKAQMSVSDHFLPSVRPSVSM